MSGSENKPRNFIGESKSEGDYSQHIGINEGEVIQSNNNTINITEFKIDSKYKDELPGLYSRALQEFEDKVNEYLKQKGTSSAESSQDINDDVKELQKSTNDVAAEVNSSMINQPNKPDEKVKATLGDKIKTVGKKLAKFLPEGISIGMAMTPLAPFAGLTGKAVGELVKDL